MSPIELLHPRSIKHLSSKLQELVSGKLWLKVLIAMLLGIIVGIFLGPSAGLVPAKIGSVLGSWLALPGQIFLAVVQMVVVPLVVASVIRGISASESLSYLKKMGVATVLFFVLTTTVSIIIGIGLAYMTKPGLSFDTAQIQATIGSVNISKQVDVAAPSIVNLPEAITGLLPKNPLGSMVELEMLQVVIFSIIIGIALVSMNSKQALPIIDLLGSMQEVCMTIVKWCMRLAPFAVFGLMAQLASSVGFNALIGLSIYAGTVLLGLLLVKIMYLIIYTLALKKSPLSYLRSTREVMLLAFSTSSSAAVMPLSIKTAEEKLGVRSSVSQFVIPLGTTINMNGTTLYQGVATIFLAQVFGIDLSIGTLVLLVITAVGSSIGSPATPGVGIVILAMVLSSVGIPAAGIGLIMGVDRILDMSRSAINVSGDLLASCLMDKYVGGKKTALEQAQLEESLDKQRDENNSDVIVLDS